MSDRWAADDAPPKRVVDTGERVFAFIDTFPAEHGYSPTVREIQRGCGLGSTQTVHYWMHRLRNDCRITFVDDTFRTVRVLE
jgi:SOS-response transcriptional repressor LexA